MLRRSPYPTGFLLLRGSDQLQVSAAKTALGLTLTLMHTPGVCVSHTSRDHLALYWHLSW